MSACFLNLKIVISYLFLLCNLGLLLNRCRHACVSLEETTRCTEETLLPTSDFVAILLLSLWVLDIMVWKSAEWKLSFWLYFWVISDLRATIKLICYIQFLQMRAGDKKLPAILFSFDFVEKIKDKHFIFP